MQYSKLSNRYAASTESSSISSATESVEKPQTLAFQYRTFVTNLAAFNLGESYYDNDSVIKVLQNHLKVSTLFFTLSLILCMPLGITLGLFLALKDQSRWARSLTQILISLNSFPTLILSLLLLLGFASYKLPLFPLGGIYFDTGVIDILKHAFLPLCVYLSQSVSLLALLIKNKVLEEISKPYSILARSKGASLSRILIVHIFPNCLSCLLQFFCHWTLIFFGMSLVVENVFSLPGLGLLSYLSTQRQDYPVLQGIILFLSLVHLSLNLMRDLLSQSNDYRQREFL